jgi:hypothetical protein
VSLLRALAAILAAHIAHADDTPPPADEHSPRQPLWTCPLDPCVQCGIAPRRAGDFCGGTCQARWLAAHNHVIPLETAPPTLPDGTTFWRTL